ncbi:Cytochrome c oxidase assembly protein CtaG [Halioglobus japonicus]|nr:Cytochrome c oxidase assembly protein CtaG [Halioglobus japonicus]
MLIKLVAGTVLMFGFSFALVPLYDLMCDALGIGKIREAKSSQTSTTITPHKLAIEFITTNTEQLDWSFYPLVKSLEVTTSETYMVNFYARNNTQKTMTVQAIPSITPVQGTDYLIKTQCFCFEQQTLEPGESIKMPVVFLIDSALPEKYATLTLSYSLFELKQETASVQPRTEADKSTRGGRT